MELPSSRELELEILLRERDAQLTELTDEVAELRQYLSKQPGPSSTDPVSLPPALLSLLLPHFNSAATKNTGSNTVTTALTQRAHQLQEENDELYELLKYSETGKLKDEVRGLRRVAAKLEDALNESHQIINSLSTELDKSYEVINSSRQINSVNSAKPHSYSPRNYHPAPQSESTGNGTTVSKQLPTGPRAYKKPRISDSQMSPPRPVIPLPSHNKSQNRNHPNTSPHPHVREHSRHESDSRGVNTKMELDDASDTLPPPARERERNRERDRNKEREPRAKERERDRGREWERDSHKNTGARRNGIQVAGSGRGMGGSGLTRKGQERNHSSTRSHAKDHTSRTLQERLGL